MPDTPAHFAFGPCFICGRPFTFNPHLVPSVPIDTTGNISATGTRRPICRDCAEPINAERERQGRPTWNITDEAYGPVEGLPE